MRCTVIGARRLVIAGLAAACLAAASDTNAWERDVHYGLTRWLALQAGFDASQAEAIGVGNDRVDGGLLDSQAFSPEYACLSRDALVAQEVQQRHYPSAVSAPATPQRRQVIADSESARRALMDLAKIVKGKEGLLLGKLGEALHPLQDSWAHQGVPSVPADRLAGTVCDAALFSGHPVALGGWTSHAADLTHLHTDEALAMARATYEALRSYPAIQGHVRQAAEWKSLEVDVQGFAKGRTKAEKLAWFVAHGMDDPRILNDLSLPGALNDVAQWPGYKLPALTQGASLQGEVPQEVRLYFDRLLERWLSSSAVESVLDDEVGELRNGAHKHQEPATRELLARLALWKLADHGSAATLAHAAAPLSNAQIQQVDRLARMPRAFVSVRSVADALFPIEAIGPKATPLLPYLVTLSATEPARATALLRLKHAPYDTLLLVAERRSGEWRLAEVVGVVNP